MLETDGGTGTRDYAYTAGTNQLASFTDAGGTRTYAYDARGNTDSEARPGGVTVDTTYDGYGRLIGYDRSNAGAQTYVYNGLDDRVTTIRPTGTRGLPPAPRSAIESVGGCRNRCERSVWR